MKKSVSLALVLLVALATQVGTTTPAYAMGVPLPTVYVISPVTPVTSYALDKYDNCIVSIKSNKLFFDGNIRDYYKTNTLNIIDQITYMSNVADINIMRSVTCAQGNTNGTAIDLSGLPDGVYNLQVGWTKPGWINGWEVNYDSDLMLKGYNMYTAHTSLLITITNGKSSLSKWDYAIK